MSFWKSVEFPSWATPDREKDEITSEKETEVV